MAHLNGLIRKARKKTNSSSSMRVYVIALRYVFFMYVLFDCISHILIFRMTKDGTLQKCVITTMSSQLMLHPKTMPSAEFFTHFFVLFCKYLSKTNYQKSDGFFSQRTSSVELLNRDALKWRRNNGRANLFVSFVV